jgi:hypothetical protein
MKTKLPRSTIFTLLILLFAFVGNVKAQCSIIGNNNASDYSCSKVSPSTSARLSGCTVVTIGDGTTSTILAMNVDLDLTCLGPILFVIKSSATLDFDAGSNKNLQLAAGSSIVIEPGGSLRSNTSCGNSDLITIGSIKVASCNAGNALVNFTTFVSNGGYSSIDATGSPTSACGQGSFTLTATAKPSIGATYKWYDAASGGNLLSGTSASNLYDTGIISTTKTYYVAASYTSPDAYTTIRKSVTVTVNPIPTVVITMPVAVCSPSTVDLTVAGITSGSTVGLSYSYWSDAAATTSYATPSKAGAGTYYIKGTTTAGCFAIKPVTVTVNPLPNNQSSDGFKGNIICQGGGPLLTFNADNSTSPPYLITYSNNLKRTIVYQVSITTTGAVSFIPGDNPTSNSDYTLLSITSGGCPRTTGFNKDTAEIRFRPIPTATISGTTTVCTGNTSPNITITNPQTNQVTVTYSINTIQTSVDIAASAQISIPVSTTTAGNFTYQLISVVYKFSPTCSSAISGQSAVVTVTATVGTPTAMTISAGTQPTCQLANGSTTTTYATTATNNTGYSWSLSNPSAGTINDTTGVMTWASGFFGSVDIQVTANGCNGPSSQVTRNVVVNQNPATPTVGTIAQPNCVVGIGIFTITNYDPSHTYTFSPSTGVNRTDAVVTAPPGDYTISASKGSCISSVSAYVSILNNVIPTTIWKNISLGVLGWSNGFPSINTKLVFEAAYNSSLDTNVTSSLGEILGCSCEVKDNVQVTIYQGHTLKVVNEVKVVGSGTLIFENNASLVQINDTAINLGDITYKRAIPAGILNTDYVYWSTPVANSKLAAIQTSTLYYSFNAPNNSWTRVDETTQMKNGVGYIVRGAGKGGTILVPALSLRTAVFKGVANNGVPMENNVVAGKNNLIGNPYPSAIDADKFLTENSGVLDGTIYFWTHNTAIQSRLNILATAGSGALAYTSNDYASYNITGGVGTNAEAIKAISAPTNDINNYKPTGIIAAGQGFFAGSKGNGKVRFNNSMRLVGGALGVNNSQFFKIPENPKSGSSIEKNRVWLNLTNSGGAFKQTLIGYVTGATNGYEGIYDGVSFNGNQFINFYSINQNTNFVIQGRALPFDENDKVPLGYKTTIAGDFKIAIGEADGFLINKKINLEDKLLGKIQDLSEAPYVFTTEVGTFNERFVLTYATKTAASTITLGTGDYKEASEAILISNKNKEIKISSSTNEIDKVFVYDLSGRQIYMALKVEKNELIINSIISSEQMLIVKVVLQNQSTVNKKIMY